MNTGRIVIGGFVSGVVLNVCDFVVNNYLLAAEWRRVAQARNIDVEVMGGTSALVTFIVVDMVFGVLLVWVYAAIRPRLGAGLVTAIIAAFAIALAYVLAMATLAESFFSWDMYIKSSALTFASMLLASIAGAYLYRENEPAEPV